MGSHAGKSRALIAFALFVGTGVRLAHAAAPTIYDLGTLGGTAGGGSEGHAINAGGQVAGYSWTAGDAALLHHAFRYTGTPGSGGAMVDLGTLGGAYSLAYAINDSGQVAGISATTENAAGHAFRYTGTPGAAASCTTLAPSAGG